MFYLYSKKKLVEYFVATMKMHVIKLFGSDLRKAYTPLIKAEKSAKLAPAPPACPAPLATTLQLHHSALFDPLRSLWETVEEDM